MSLPKFSLFSETHFRMTDFTTDLWGVSKAAAEAKTAAEAKAKTQAEAEATAEKEAADKATLQDSNEEEVSFMPVLKKGRDKVQHTAMVLATASAAAAPAAQTPAATVKPAPEMLDVDAVKDLAAEQGPATPHKGQVSAEDFLGARKQQDKGGQGSTVGCGTSCVKSCQSNLCPSPKGTGQGAGSLELGEGRDGKEGMCDDSVLSVRSSASTPVKISSRNSTSGAV
jgi:membrane protein involved in colicin uptake